LFSIFIKCFLGTGGVVKLCSVGAESQSYDRELQRQRCKNLPHIKQKGFAWVLKN
jgi:hypothetical protein